MVNRKIIDEQLQQIIWIVECRIIHDQRRYANRQKFRCRLPVMGCQRMGRTGSTSPETQKQEFSRAISSDTQISNKTSWLLETET